MTSHRDRASKRLAELFGTAEDSRIDKKSPLLQDLASENGLNVDLDDQRFFDLCAGIALKAPGGPFDKVVQVAFDKAGLDRNNPFHWTLLMWYFAWAHFGPRAKRGAKPKWDGTQYTQLLDQVQKIVAESPNIKVESDVIRVLKKRDPRRFGKMSDRQIRRLLSHACDPNKNFVLGNIVGPWVLGSRRDHLRRGVEWTPITEAQVTKRMVSSILDVMGLGVLDSN